MNEDDLLKTPRDTPSPKLPSLKDIEFKTSDEDTHPEYISFKIIIIGDMGSGKTSFVKRYTKGIFSDSYKSTIGVDFSAKKINWTDNIEINIQMWDVAGQERFGAQTKIYFRDAKGAIIMCDLTKKNVSDSAKKWRKLVAEKTQLADGSFYDPPCLLLMNKNDLVEQGAFDEFYIKKLSDELECIAGFPISVKNNAGVDDAMQILITKILEEKKYHTISNEEDVILLDEQQEVISQKSCSC